MMPEFIVLIWIVLIQTFRKGTLSSFNWDPTISPQRQYMPKQHYNMCFRRASSDCRLELKRSATAPDFSTSVGR